MQIEVRKHDFTECVLEVLDDGRLPGAVFSLHIVGRHEARFVGGVSDPPPGLGVVEEPEALVLLDVQLLVLLGHVVELGDDNHLFRHLAPSTLEKKHMNVRMARIYITTFQAISICIIQWHLGQCLCLEEQ